MKLKGKAKELFEEWYIKESYTEEMYSLTLVEYFYVMPEAFQWGVYVDFFDSLGIEIDIFRGDSSMMWRVMIGYEIDEQGLNSRQEARTKALEKAQEVVNNK